MTRKKEKMDNAATQPGAVINQFSMKFEGRVTL
ncbi:MAG TPA: hypothetical protein DEB17_11580 [Chlorobaculum sp.]|uniref:Uncharacterized protein n=1 Tax=Chlorobaculum tepidum (strain ATCC 49652 / DSM 12025 / NBRC 103806 / TLS) TaxID=194439 RepID=Q8KCV3_CHLTE|nr:hypothetical protein CT1307 [Chlorobaculum tepidum TLS]HBU24605.1 hypothetical protein [Chlorobaculum sp.]